MTLKKNRRGCGEIEEKKIREDSIPKASSVVSRRRERQFSELRTSPSSANATCYSAKVKDKHAVE